MTKFAITAVALDADGEVTRAQVQQIVGRTKIPPVLDTRREIKDRLALVDMLGRGDELYALVQGDGQMLPPYRVRIRPRRGAIEHIETVVGDRVTDAFSRLPRLPKG
jgi:hypothetical protein